MAAAKADLEERAAPSARSAPTSRCAPAGLGDRREFLRSRLTEVEERLAGSVEARREAEVAPATRRRQTAVDRLAALVADRLETVEREHGRPSSTA